MTFFTQISAIKSRMSFSIKWFATIAVVIFSAMGSNQMVMAKTSPNLVVTTSDVDNMRSAIKKEGKFKRTYLAQKLSVDQQISQPITVPTPKDGGGGYTHERHKKNYKSTIK